MRRTLVLLLIASLPFPAQAQDDGGGYLETFLEDTFSGMGRDVRITGFAGALSSVASVQSITIADSQGVWLTLNGVKLDWSRSALLSGEVTVSELSAEEIIVARSPVSESTSIQPEAQGFSLPDLPVSIEIGRVAAARIIIEPEVFGQAVEGSLEASLSLIAGEGKASLDLLRNDTGPAGEITLDASYSNANRQLGINLKAVEGKDGLVTTLLGLPGAPAADVSITGSGPFDDFRADILVATDGTDRLTGSVLTKADAEGSLQFSADLSGDLAPLFLPEYSEFFGPRVGLVIEGKRSAGGLIDVSAFKATTQSLLLSGSASLGSDGLPERFSLAGKLASPDGSSVLLPVGTTRTAVRGADLAINFDKAAGDDWTGSFQLDGLDRPDFKADSFTIDASGRIERTVAGRSFGATVKFASTGLLPADDGIARALGSAIEGQLTARWLEGDGSLSLPDIRIEGEDYSVKAALKVKGLDDALLTTGQVVLDATDLSRFAALTGRQLAGAGRVSLSGSASRLSGFFDVSADIAGKGLEVGIAELDRLLEGDTTARLAVRRDESGTSLQSFQLKAKSLSVTGSGKLSNTAADLKGKLVLTDLASLGRQYRGTATVDAGFSGRLDDGKLTIRAEASNLGLGMPEVDRLLAGRNVIQTTLRVKEGVFQIEDALITNPQVNLAATGTVAGAKRTIVLDAKLANLAILVSGFPGELRLSGTANQDAAGYQLDLRASGPGQTVATVRGGLANDLATADLAVSGTAQAALANVFLEPRSVAGPVTFDLRLIGPPRLSSLSGRLALSGGRITDPALGFAFERTEAIFDLAGGSARVVATTEPSSGGKIRLDGSVGLQNPFVGDFAISLDRVRLVEPDLYQTYADGSLSVTGPMTGGALIAGRINLSETEISVPSTGFGGASGLPDLKHRAEPEAVRSTRRKAGLIENQSRPGEGTGSGRFRLDLQVEAPNRVFIRGRGIDAELGGSLRLTGTTNSISPSGEFSLIRGRLDILGKRLVLSEASLTLQGDFIPEISVSANTESDGIVSFVTINGPVDAPQVSFTSNPDLPQEEVLSRLLFGRGLDTISPLQAAQLANAVAVLAGRGGIGVIGRLRQGFGLDDLDLTTGEDGSTALRAGKYLSENVYTEIEVDQEGKSRINLNLDVRPGITLKGKVGADGETGIGIFVERDY